MRSIVGIATLRERREFFENKTLPSLTRQASQVVVYHDKVDMEDLPDNKHPEVSRISTLPYRNLGDAGKFLGFQMWRNNLRDSNFYYFTCDDDLIYPPTYIEDMIEWIDYYDKKAVVSLHGSTFTEFPIKSYYYGRVAYGCLTPLNKGKRVLFPGTGVTAFHSSLIPDLNIRQFRHPNMADIWLGLYLQEKKIPAIVIPHSGEYLTYNEDLPLKETIWGKESKDALIQTAVINQFSYDQGFRYPPLPLPEDPPPSPLRPRGPVSEPHPEE